MRHIDRKHIDAYRGIYRDVPLRNSEELQRDDLKNLWWTTKRLWLFSESDRNSHPSSWCQPQTIYVLLLVPSCILIFFAIFVLPFHLYADCPPCLFWIIDQRPLCLMYARLQPIKTEFIRLEWTINNTLNICCNLSAREKVLVLFDKCLPHQGTDSRSDCIKSGTMDNTNNTFILNLFSNWDSHYLKRHLIH